MIHKSEERYVMTELILTLGIVALVGFLRFLYIKSKNVYYKLRPFIYILILGIVFLISYFMTDTNAGIFYIFIMNSIIVLMVITDIRSDNKWLRYFSYIVGIPILFFLSIINYKYIVFYPSYILPLLIIIFFLAPKSKNMRKYSKGEKTAFIGVILVLIIFIAVYSKISGSGLNLKMKPERVAQSYLVENLDKEEGWKIIMVSPNGKIRGEKIDIIAIGPSEKSITMVYKNNEIISFNLYD